MRKIYLPKKIIDVLREEKQRQQSLKAELGQEYQDFNLVVSQNNGRPYEEHKIIAKLRNLIKENDLKPVVFHSLRHSSTSMKLRISGGDIKSVQKDTGHSQARMVTDVYSHSFNADRKHLARKVNEQILDIPTQNAKTAAPEPVLNESAYKLMQLLKASPEKAEKLLQVYNLIEGGI